MKKQNERFNMVKENDKKKENENVIIGNNHIWPIFSEPSYVYA